MSETSPNVSNLETLNNLPRFVCSQPESFRWRGYDVKKNENALCIEGTDREFMCVDYRIHSEHLFIYTSIGTVHRVDDDLELYLINTYARSMDVVDNILVVVVADTAYLYDIDDIDTIGLITVCEDEKLYIIDMNNYIILSGSYATWNIKCGDKSHIQYFNNASHVSIDYKNKLAYLAFDNKTNVYNYSREQIRSLPLQVVNVYDDYVFDANCVYTSHGLRLQHMTVVDKIYSHVPVDHKIPERLYDCLPDMPSPLVRIIASYI